jgi:hypothetical protein
MDNVRYSVSRRPTRPHAHGFVRRIQDVLTAPWSVAVSLRLGGLEAERQAGRALFPARPAPFPGDIQVLAAFPIGVAMAPRFPDGTTACSTRADPAPNSAR